MRIFINEVKKLFDWKILLTLAVLGAIAGFIILGDALGQYESLTKHGIYGSYQTEMFRLYGDTLEPEELEDFNFPQRYAQIAAKGDVIVAQEPIFAKYGITSFMEYIEITSESYSEEDGYLSPLAIDPDDLNLMVKVLEGNNPATIEEWFDSPLMRWGNLKMLEWRYADYDEWLVNCISTLRGPIAEQAAEKVIAAGRTNLINEYLLSEFSVYVAAVGAFAVVAAIFLVMPPLVTDRSRNVNLLQYSSFVGRKILKIQFAASVASAFILSAAIITLSFAPFIALAAEYWNTSIMSPGWSLTWLYDITFGQYVFILAGTITALCVCAASIAFILARLSNHAISAMIKAVPVGLALLGLCAISVYNALSSDNIVFYQVFQGRLHAPEVFVCCVLGAIAFIAAAVMTAREKRVDVL